MAKGLSPTQRSLKYLRGRRFTCQIVEHWNAFAHVRQDLFGAIDIVCIAKSSHGVLGIQCTSTGNISHRLEKILGLPALKIWLQANNRLWILGWSKKGARGKRKLWTHTIRIVTLEDFA